MTKKTPMTTLGAEKLRAELQNLISVERPTIIQAISEARAHGDLKENAEYHAAKERQSFIEGRILDLQSKLSNAEIIDITQLDAGGRVVFGATVTVANVETDEETTYQIVGEDEANIQAGKLSIYSPIARALIGKEQGDSVEVRAPAGRIEYEIVDVQYI